MMKTTFGRKVEGWTAAAKLDFQSDLNKLPKVSQNVLRAVVGKITKTYPACNMSEIVALEAEQHSITDWKWLYDAASAVAFVFGYLDGESPKDITADLVSLGLISNEAAEILAELLSSAAPMQETAKAVSAYLKVGSPLFVSIRGTVDIRLRFHSSEDDFISGKQPSTVVGTQPVILVNLATTDAEEEDKVATFLMDENDLTALKRFVRNMEREVELAKSLLGPVEHKAQNG